MKKQSVAILCILWVTVGMPALFFIGLYSYDWVFFLAIALLFCFIIGYHLIHPSQTSITNDRLSQSPVFETEIECSLVDNSSNAFSNQMTNHYSYTEEYNILSGRLPGSF